MSATHRNATSWATVLAALIAGAAAVACMTPANTLDGTFDPPFPDAANVDVDEQGGVGIVDGGAGTGSNTGLPCDVQALLEIRCIACHSGKSPAPLLTYADLVAPSPTVSGKTVAQVSLDRMKSTTSPMPPAPAVPPTAQEIATFETWVNGGTKMGQACAGDGGTPTADGGAVDAGQNPYSAPPKCTSNKFWTSGNSGNLAPGQACQACHQKQGGPAFTIAGTVYPTAHEPVNCNGAPGPMQVVVTDKNAKVVTINVNSVGNFSSNSTLAAPFTVKVVNGVKTRPMAGALTSGDCNSCHTQNGANGAPGRILAP